MVLVGGVLGAVRVAMMARHCSEKWQIVGDAEQLLKQGGWRRLQVLCEHTLIES